MSIEDTISGNDLVPPPSEKGELPTEKFQTIDDIRFVEAKKTQNPDLTVYLQEGDDLSQELARLMEEKYWWMAEYWSRKGLPKEQLTIKTGNEEINLYNWDQRFSPRQIA